MAKKPPRPPRSSRSYNMSQIHSKNTKPEVLVRKYLFARGFRYRKNVSTLPGTPDIVIPKYRACIFVNGCFWHMHNCSCFRMPSTNVDYWQPKLTRNMERDCENQALLTDLGWHVIVVWECELKKQLREKRLEDLVLEIVLLA